MSVSALSDILCFTGVLCIAGNAGDISIGMFVDAGICTLIKFLIMLCHSFIIN